MRWVRKAGLSRTLDEEGDFADRVHDFLKDAGKLVSAAMRAAAFTPEPPSREVYGDAPGVSRAERAAFDLEAGRQFVAEAAATIFKTPGWFGLSKKEQAKMLEVAHKAAVDKALSPHIKPLSYTDSSRKRRVAGAGPLSRARAWDDLHRCFCAASDGSAAKLCCMREAARTTPNQILLACVQASRNAAADLTRRRGQGRAVEGGFGRWHQLPALDRVH